MSKMINIAKPMKEKNIIMLQVKNYNMHFKTDSNINKRILKQLIEEMICNSAPVWAIETISKFYNDDSINVNLNSIYK